MRRKPSALNGGKKDSGDDPENGRGRSDAAYVMDASTSDLKAKLGWSGVPQIHRRTIGDKRTLRRSVDMIGMARAEDCRELNSIGILTAWRTRRTHRLAPPSGLSKAGR